MRKFLIYPVVFMILFSCDTVKEKTKQTINKTGETVGKGTSEFVAGVSKGIDETFESKVEVSAELTGKGLSFGKYNISKGSEGGENVLSIYLIFDQDIRDTLVAKVFDENGREYGRAFFPVSSEKGNAHYADFAFDKRTTIETKSKFLISRK